jgi:hypothetical protein
MNNKDLMKILEQNKHFRNTDELNQFYDAALELDPTDSGLLPDLFYFFDDEIEEDLALEFLASFIWRIDNVAVVISMVHVTPKIVAKSEGWLDIFYTIPLLDEQLLQVLIEELGKLSDNEREVLMNFLDNLSAILDVNNETDRKMQEGIDKVKSIYSKSSK